MTGYVLTFYTHYGALRMLRELAATGAKARLAPVPRALSSSCGTCVLLEADAPPESKGEDMEALYRVNGEEYEKLYQNGAE